MKKIKVAMVVTHLGLNGISSVIMNYCRLINMKKFEITIFAGSPIDSSYTQECRELGVKIIELPSRKPTTFQYYCKLMKEMKKSYFDVIHIHGNSSAMILECLIAKIKKIKVKIAHCHNSNCSNKWMNKLLKIVFKRMYDRSLACSEDAGKWAFDDNFLVLPNGFVVDKFKFNNKFRTEIRNTFNIESDEIVFGHTGRFNNQKNQEFIIDLICKMYDKGHNVKLMLVGAGPNFEENKNKILNSKYKDRIIFVGETVDVYQYYSAMDAFLFPSKYEGLGISILEAQLNGLNCIASIYVPTSAAITDNVKFLDISSIEDWYNYTLSYKKINKRTKVDFLDNRIQFYNIENGIKILEKVYIEEFSKKVR